MKLSHSELPGLPATEGEPHWRAAAYELLSNGRLLEGVEIDEVSNEYTIPSIYNLKNMNREPPQDQAARC